MQTEIKTSVGALLLAVMIGQANAIDLTGTVFEKAGDKFNVDPQLIYSIAIVESAVASEDFGRKYINPYPFALRTDKPYYPKTRSEANRVLKSLLRKNKSVDVGLCQINTLWHGYRVSKITDLLDPQINANVAAKILSESIEKYPNDAVTAIGAYHSTDPARARRYAQSVLRVYTRIKLIDGGSE